MDFHAEGVKQKTETRTFLKNTCGSLCHILPTDITAVFQILLVEIIRTAELQESNVPTVKMEDTKLYI